MRRLALLGAAASLLVGAASCGASNGDADGPVLRVGARRDTTTMLAGVGGRLERDPATGCLELAGTTVVWPAGTTWRPDPPAVVTSTGKVLPVGQTVSGGGGYIDASGLDGFAGGDLVAAVERCGGSSLVLVQTEPTTGSL